MDSTAAPAIQIESWVDADALAAHLGFKPDHIRKLAQAGKIPARQCGNGKRKYWRFKISEVDAFLSLQHTVAQVTGETRFHITVDCPEVDLAAKINEQQARIIQSTDRMVIAR